MASSLVSSPETSLPETSNQVERCATCAHWSLESPPVCAICRGGLGDTMDENEDNQLIRLACSHTFHEVCFTGYERHLPAYNPLTCPVCRRHIPRMNGEGRPADAVAPTPMDEIEEMEQAILESRRTHAHAAERLYVPNGHSVQQNTVLVPRVQQPLLRTRNPLVRFEDDNPYETSSQRMQSRATHMRNMSFLQPLQEPREFTAAQETTFDRIFGGGGYHQHYNQASRSRLDFYHPEKRHYVNSIFH